MFVLRVVYSTDKRVTVSPQSFPERQPNIALEFVLNATIENKSLCINLLK